MPTSIRLTDSNVIERLRSAYLRTLVAPMDGMWEGAVIGQAAFWSIRNGDVPIGHYCIDDDNTMLRFYLENAYGAKASEVFRSIVLMHGIRKAVASTIEPPYLFLCLALRTSLSIHSYLFRDNTHVELSCDLDASILRKAARDDLDDLVRFYHDNIDGEGAWVETFLRERLALEEVFVLYDGAILAAAGECIRSHRQPPYADLGMVVARSHRGRGLASFMLTRLKQHCAHEGWTPLCSCAADNRASRRAIVKAGFVADHYIAAIALA